MFIFVILGTYVILKPLLWHMGGEYRPIACPNYPLDGIKDLRLLTTAQDVIHIQDVIHQEPCDHHTRNPICGASTYLLMIMLGVFKDV